MEHQLRSEAEQKAFQYRAAVQEQQSRAISESKAKTEIQEKFQKLETEFESSREQSEKIVESLKTRLTKSQHDLESELKIKQMVHGQLENEHKAKLQTEEELKNLTGQLNELKINSAKEISSVKSQASELISKIKTELEEKAKAYADTIIKANADAQQLLLAEKEKWEN